MVKVFWSKKLYQVLFTNFLWKTQVFPMEDVRSCVKTSYFIVVMYFVKTFLGLK